LDRLAASKSAPGAKGKTRGETIALTAVLCSCSVMSKAVPTKRVIPSIALVVSFENSPFEKTTFPEPFKTFLSKS
jgi:hypothetical protein